MGEEKNCDSTCYDNDMMVGRLFNQNRKAISFWESNKHLLLTSWFNQSQAPSKGSRNGHPRSCPKMEIGRWEVFFMVTRRIPTESSGNNYNISPT